MLGGLPAALTTVVAIFGWMSQIKRAEVAQKETVAAQAAATAAQASEQQTEALKQVDDELAQAIKLAEPSTQPEVESPPKDTDAVEIDQLVLDLFSQSGAARVRAYEKLTGQYRAKSYAVDQILATGVAELSKPAENQNFIGVYHTIVTLTDMSRAVTQQPITRRDALITYATQAAGAFPKLTRRVDTLNKWLRSKR